MAEFVVFGGTTEGRELADFFARNGISAMVCVATEYGESMLEETACVGVHTGRLDTDAMQELLHRENPKAVIDATHPYAANVSENIVSACKISGYKYIRVTRASSEFSGTVMVDTMAELVEYLNTGDEIIFSTLGSREAPALAGVKDFEKRIWLRILPTQESLQICQDAGFPLRHVICMHGPFSRQLNEAMFCQTNAGILVTKESGAAGGFREKIEAANKLGMKAVVLRRPTGGQGISLAELERTIGEGIV